MVEAAGGSPKIGLCLSGGGFRAALYHIGTLAALAEAGVLHRVEVLSTVSGGSIIGAYYYLKVKELYETPRAAPPGPQDCLELVQDIERDFLSAVQKNLRMRLLLHPLKTAKMMLEEDYTRSDRVAELLDKFFFQPIAHKTGLRLEEIHVTPAGQEKQQFNVVEHNKTDEYKIPILTINATDLNTGHPWHFTGSWLGEPARTSQRQSEQNTNVSLPQLRFDGYYQDDKDSNLPREQWRRVTDEQLRKMKTITLAEAVAASAAVPGIFPPLPIHDLYYNSAAKEIVVELSDGGVFDNQGLDALLAAKCTHIFISDACGQLEDERILGTDMVSVIQRANNVMMERIRGMGFAGLELQKQVQDGLVQDGLVQGCTFTHLRQVLDGPGGLPGPGNRDGGIVYRLSGVRTDLDSFSELEVYALMYHAYTLAQARLGQGADFPANPQGKAQWQFLGISETLSTSAGKSRLYEHLHAGKNLAFKCFYTAPLKAWAVTLAYAAPLLAYAAYWLAGNWGTSIELTLPTVTWGEVVVGVISLLPLSPQVREWFKTVQFLRKAKESAPTQLVKVVYAIAAVGISLVASVLVLAHLNIYDRIFLTSGKLRNHS